MIELKELDSIPAGLLSADVTDLAKLLQQPTLLKLSGRKKEPLFVSTLLHGNEHSGFIAVQQLLRKYQFEELPRDLIVLIGNVQAATCNERTVGVDVDYNRIWDNPEKYPMVKRVHEVLQNDNVFALVDVHNNTGRNPHYSLISKLKPGDVGLASLFGRTVIHFVFPESALSVFASRWLPAVTLEVGVSRDPVGIEKTIEYLDACLHLDHLQDSFPKPADINLYYPLGRLSFREDVSFDFGLGTECDVYLRDDLDYLNFSPMQPGTQLGLSRISDPFVMIDAYGKPLLDKKPIVVEGGKIKVKESFVPAMFTRNKKNVRIDCIGYLMLEKEFTE